MRRTIAFSALCLLVFTVVGCERDPRKPGYEFLPEMVHPIPYEAYAPNPNTADGKTMQRPVAGTIPRGFLPYPYPDDRERAGRELRNPLPADTQILARGQEVYETFCLICHGVMGKGDGPLIPKFPNPPSLTAKSVLAMSAGEIYHVITMGVGQMESYASQIAPEDRWKLVHYVQALQGKKRAEETP